nr:SAV_2336 N-terminal domain-related protein [Actinomadura rayongensis]
MADGERLSVREICDVLWLCRNPPPPDDPGPGADEPGRPDVVPPPEVPDEPLTGTGGMEPAGEASLYRPDDRAEGTVPDAPSAGRVALRTAPELPRGLDIARSLRRFKRVTRPGPAEIDIEASVEAIAEARVFTVRTHRPEVRVLDLSLVVDAGSSMRVWSRTFDALEAVLAQVGAFRTVTRWELRLRGGDVRIADAGGAEHPPGRLADPSGSRLVLVATDAVGDGWYDREGWEAIGAWAAQMPTALLQMLPRRYWPDTAHGAPGYGVQAKHPGAPNSACAVRHPPWVEDSKDPLLPVVSLEAGALRRWADAVVAGTGWADAVPLPSPPETARPAVANRALTPDERVRAFRHRASPGARRLAEVLSGASRLDLPLIAALQRDLVRDTGLEERAELFVGGLLEEVEPDVYGFRDGVADLLQHGATAFERYDALNAAYAHGVRQGYWPGTGFDHMLALLRDDAGLDRLDPRARPFAVFARDFAVRLGLMADSPGPSTAETGGRGTGPNLRTGPDTGLGTGLGTGPDVEAPEATRPESVPPPVPVPSGAEERLTREAFRSTLDELVAGLGDTPLTLFELGGSGVAAHAVRRDGAGTPRHAIESSRWDGSARTVWPPGWSPGDGAFVLGTTGAPPGLLTALADTALGRADAPGDLGAVSLRAVIPPRVSVASTVREAIAASAITRRYALVVLRRHPETGELELDQLPLFEPGARRGDVTGRTVRCEPGGPRGVVFAVVAVRDRSPRLLHKGTAILPPGRHTVTAMLRQPGRVEFKTQDGPLRPVPDDRSWRELVASVPKSFNPPPGPAHLVCAVEVSGPAETVAARLDAAREVAGALADALQGRALVSMVTYGRHTFDRWRRDERPVSVPAWSVPPYEAMRALDRVRRDTGGRGDRSAAMVEDMLRTVARRVTPGPGRSALLVVGASPPHPPRTDVRSEILPCPERIDWRRELAQLSSRGMHLGAIGDAPSQFAAERIPLVANPEPPATGAKTYATDAWRTLSADAQTWLGAVDARRVVAELGLLPADLLPFPLVETA